MRTGMRRFRLSQRRSHLLRTMKSRRQQKQMYEKDDLLIAFNGSDIIILAYKINNVTVQNVLLENVLPRQQGELDTFQIPKIFLDQIIEAEVFGIYEKK